MKIIADFLFRFYLLDWEINHAANHTQLCRQKHSQMAQAVADQYKGL